MFPHAPSLWLWNQHVSAICKWMRHQLITLFWNVFSSSYNRMDCLWQGLETRSKDIIISGNRLIIVLAKTVDTFHSRILVYCIHIGNRVKYTTHFLRVSIIALKLWKTKIFSWYVKSRISSERNCFFTTLLFPDILFEYSIVSVKFSFTLISHSAVELQQSWEAFNNSNSLPGLRQLIRTKKIQQVIAQYYYIVTIRLKKQ